MDHFLEVLRENVFLFSVIGSVVAVLGLAFAIYKAAIDRLIHSLEQQLKAAKEAGDPVILKEQNGKLLQDNGNLQNLLGAADAERNALQCQYDELEAAAASVTATLQAEREASQQIVDGLTGKLEGLQEDWPERIVSNAGGKD